MQIFNEIFAKISQHERNETIGNQTPKQILTERPPLPFFCSTKLDRIMVHMFANWKMRQNSTNKKENELEANGWWISNKRYG